MENQKDEVASRVRVINAVRTPLSFFTLVVLICEIILGGLATRATGIDFTLLVSGMLLVLGARPRINTSGSSRHGL